MVEINGLPTPEKLTQKFNAALKELMLTPGSHFMDKNRDYRDFSATIRAIQRMVSGETRVSGEMMVIVNMLLRQHRRLKENPDLKWERNQHGACWATVFHLRRAAVGSPPAAVGRAPRTTARLSVAGSTRSRGEDQGS
ncbi:MULTISPECIES: hypothetical protein [unclassified Mesorhizobium]|uniref:hypothetical protein n=1 Tax=unclassified Mesorhizobium TaxID=325217 RepID=UPI0019D19C90|nr:MULTISPECIES: hypothetical protein [unclassified Mesorhizobium]